MRAHRPDLRSATDVAVWTSLAEEARPGWLRIADEVIRMLDASHPTNAVSPTGPNGPTSTDRIETR